MTLLPSDPDAVLDLARSVDDPPPGAEERTRAALAAKLGAVAGLGVAAHLARGAPVTSITSTAAAGVGALSSKVVAVVALTLLAGAGAGVAVTAWAPARPQAKSAVVGAPPASPASASTPVSPVAPPVAAGSPVTSLEDETRLVQSGDAALRAGDPARALSLFDEHARRFPSGVLAEERGAERILALCALGRTDEALAGASAFLRDHGQSPLAAKVRASCGGGGARRP